MTDFAALEISSVIGIYNNIVIFIITSIINLIEFVGF